MQPEEIRQDEVIGLLDENGFVLNTIVCPLEQAPEGNWAKCPYWIGIGLHIDTPEPLRPYTWENKQTALQYLADTDWTAYPDVSDTSRHPHLINAEEFAVYRNQIRAIAVNPTAGPIDWPTIPMSNWSV